MISSFSEPIPVTSTTYQTTSSGNLISTRARIYGATAIILHGRNVIDPGVILRGDLRRSLLGSSASAGGGKTESDGQMAIVMGRYCRIGEDSVIRPPGKMTKGVFNYYKLSISDCVDIGERCVVEALSIGRGVTIGDDCIIGKFAIIRDYATIDPGSVLPSLAVVPSLTRWSGNPAHMVSDLPETTPEIMDALMRAEYKRYKVVKPVGAEGRKEAMGR